MGPVFIGAGSAYGKSTFCRGIRTGTDGKGIGGVGMGIVAYGDAVPGVGVIIIRVALTVSGIDSAPADSYGIASIIRRI